MDPTKGLPPILATGVSATPASASPASVSPASGSAPLTPAQTKALAKLHSAATQFESVFVDMLFKEMRKNAPPTSLTGKPSNADNVFADMLDEKRSDAVAQTGSFGIGKMLEQQLRARVLEDADKE